MRLRITIEDPYPSVDHAEYWRQVVEHEGATVVDIEVAGDDDA